MMHFAVQRILLEPSLASVASTLLSHRGAPILQTMLALIAATALTQDLQAPEPTIPIRKWKITAQLSTGGQREGQLIVAESDQVGSSGYLEWKATAQRPVTME